MTANGRPAGTSPAVRRGLVPLRWPTCARAALRGAGSARPRPPFDPE